MKFLTRRKLEDTVTNLSESEDELDAEEASDDDMENPDQQIQNVILDMPIEFEDGVVVSGNLESEVTENLEGEEVDENSSNS